MAQASEKIIETMVEAGIDHVFTLPGGGMGRIFSALYDYRDRVKVILVRNEQTASCMAEMYGRLTGKPGVIIGQGPFIAPAGIFGMMQGYLTATPPQEERRMPFLIKRVGGGSNGRPNGDL